MVHEANVSFDALRSNNEGKKKECLVIYFNNLFVRSPLSLHHSLARSVALAVSVTLAFAQMRRRMCTNVLWKSPQLSHVMMLRVQQVITNERMNEATVNFLHLRVRVLLAASTTTNAKVCAAAAASLVCICLMCNCKLESFCPCTMHIAHTYYISGVVLQRRSRAMNIIFGTSVSNSHVDPKTE